MARACTPKASGSDTSVGTSAQIKQLLKLSMNNLSH